MNRPLSGKTAWVTGGTRGIGYAIAERLVADGAQVTITGRAESGAGPSESHYISADFEDLAAIENLAAKLAAARPDILINCAGINKLSPFADISTADFARVHQVNVMAPFQLCRAAVPGMKAKEWGRIVNLASIWSKVGKELRAPYATSKFGLVGMTSSLAAEVASLGILANCVSPGPIETEMTRQSLSAKALRKLLDAVPAGRLGQPEEVAACVAWLAGPENTFITGQNIAIDGGFTRV